MPRFFIRGRQKSGEFFYQGRMGNYFLSLEKAEKVAKAFCETQWYGTEVIVYLVPKGCKHPYVLWEGEIMSGFRHDSGYYDLDLNSYVPPTVTKIRPT